MDEDVTKFDQVERDALALDQLFTGILVKGILSQSSTKDQVAKLAKQCRSNWKKPFRYEWIYNLLLLLA